MREILFRGKRADNGEWVYGDLVHIGNKSYISYYYESALSTFINDTIEYDGISIVGVAPFIEVDPSTVGQYTGLKDKNGKRIFEDDIVSYYHHKKSLVPVTDIKPEENHYGKDEESGLPLAYRTTKVIRYKGHVELHPVEGMTINLKNRCQWWRHVNYEDDSINSDRLEVIGSVHDNPELLEVK